VPLRKCSRGIDKISGFPFVGMLFTGIMLTPTGPKVLEYNVRFGDPETEALMLLLREDVDLLALLMVGQLFHVGMELLAELNTRPVRSIILTQSVWPPGTVMLFLSSLRLRVIREGLQKASE